jgi:hypothetical protein
VCAVLELAVQYILKKFNVILRIILYLAALAGTPGLYQILVGSGGLPTETQ